MSHDESQSAIDEAVAELPGLVQRLKEETTTMAIVGADGQWRLEQNGAVRLQPTPLDAEGSQSVVDAVHRHGASALQQGWWIRPLRTSHTSSVLIERRPGATPNGLSPHSLELLRSRIPRNSNGLIFGQSRAARSNVLLSLARFLPPDLIVYIGPIPPVAPHGTEVLHLFPPRDDRDRHQMGMLFERASAVLFDGSIGRPDIRTLLSGSTIANRWLSADANSPDEWASNLILSPRLKAPINAHIGITDSALESIRLDYVAVREHQQWEVLFEQDDIRESGSGPATNPEHDELRLSSQVTSPIDHRNNSAIGLGNANSSTAQTTSPPPGESSDFDVQELMEDDDDPPLSERESGEIDVPGFVSQRHRELSSDSEASAPEHPTPDELRGERIDDELPGLVASSDIDDVDFPELAPEQLRQTYSEDVDIESLRRERQLQRERSQAHDNAIPPGPVVDDDPDTEPVSLDPLEDELSEASDADSDDPVPDAEDRRTIAVRSRDRDDHTEATTAELGAFSKRNIVPADEDEDRSQD